MKIVADMNIPLVQDAFADLGEVVLVSGRDIRRETVADASILLVRSVTRVNAGLLEGSRVRFVATATTGTEHVDLAYLQKNGIGFGYAPGSNANSVAEYVVASVLLIAEKKRKNTGGLNIGIIGAGNIGSRVHRYAEALEMRCILNDPPLYRKSGDEMFRPLDEVLEHSDIITVHVPLVNEGVDPTFHLVDDSFLRRMKRGAILINTSRGATMNDDSIKDHREKLGGLVLDVWNNEPEIDPVLCDTADIATPHIAGYSYDGKIEGTRMIYEAACAFFSRPAAVERFKQPVEKCGFIDCTESSDPVFEAVMAVVPIVRDSATLKKSISRMAAGEGGNYFDSLRANYPERREFSHFSVACGRDRVRERSILCKLGFSIDD